MMKRLRRNLSVSILLSVSITLTVLFYYNTWALSRSLELAQARHKEEHRRALDHAMGTADPSTDILAIGERLAKDDPAERYVITDDRGSILFDSDRTDPKVGLDVSRLTEDEHLGFASAPWQHPYRNLRYRFFAFWDREHLVAQWMRQAHVTLGVSLLCCGVLLLGVIHRLTGRASAKYEQLVREIEELEEHRLKSRKLEALSKIAAGVAHEIRNPLNSIGIGIQRLQMEHAPEGVPEFREMTSLLIEEVERVNRIIEEFLRFSRPPRITVSEFDLRELVAETISLYREDAAQRGVRLTLDTPAGAFPIQADHDQLKQALVNVILNGIQAAPQDSGAVTVELAARGASYLLRVSDNGAGIHPDTREKIFDLYFTTKESGTGMGLFLVQRIIENGHGGHVRVDSAPGRTTFEFELPRVAAVTP